MLMRDVGSLLAGVRIGPVPRPAVIFAFVDGVRLLQHEIAQPRCVWSTGSFSLVFAITPLLRT
jgi:hypothetical protein